jgi:hypothetical protein
MSTSGSFDGSTTTRSDYLSQPLPPKYHRKLQVYMKTNAPFMSLSTQKEAYQTWDLSKIPKKVKEERPYLPANDDRDFQSTTQASYVGHESKRVLASLFFSKKKMIVKYPLTNTHKRLKRFMIFLLLFPFPQLLPTKKTIKRGTYPPSIKHPKQLINITTSP